MNLKEKIINELKRTSVPNIDKMLQYMEKNGYFECSCHSHNTWKGGTAQHMWAVYLVAKSLRDQNLNDPLIKQYATDPKLAIVCLLHDICDMRVTVYDYRHNNISHKHGTKSYYIMKNLNVGTEIERKVVKHHMHKYEKINSSIQEKIDEYDTLHNLITKADHIASATAWNSTRFIKGRTQRHGTPTKDLSYLRATAMDRTVQSADSHVYMDEKYELREYRNYNRNTIQWNIFEDFVLHIDNIDQKKFDDNLDVITAAHQYTNKTNKRLCLVVGVNSVIPTDKDTRLRRGWIDEQDILICSNILKSFYISKLNKVKGSKRFRFEFTMRDEIKLHFHQLAEQKGGIYLKDVIMIRDGSSRGFPFVEPWKVDILLVPNKKNMMFAVLIDALK